MKNYSTEISTLRDWLDDAGQVIVGAGSGLTASGGINYNDPELCRRWFPEYYRLGIKTVYEVISLVWWVSDKNATAYYAVWGKHIMNVRYKSSALEPYRILAELISSRDYFIITTNVDKQFDKAGLDKGRIFAMQGDYGKFQCSRPCSDELYDNEHMITRMLADMTDEYNIKKENIPYCPRCGSYLIPNLRKDSTFVGQPHMKNAQAYSDKLEIIPDTKTLLLELGVGFNTPSLIRYPFERLVAEYPDTVKLARINIGEADLPPNFPGNALSIDSDITTILKQLAE